MLHNRSFAKDCLISRNPEADFQQEETQQENVYHPRLLELGK